VAVASVVGHALAGRAVVVDTRFLPPAACRPAPASLVLYRHTPPSTTVKDSASRRARAFIARPFFWRPRPRRRPVQGGFALVLARALRLALWAPSGAITPFHAVPSPALVLLSRSPPPPFVAAAAAPVCAWRPPALPDGGTRQCIWRARAFRPPAGGVVLWAAAARRWFERRPGAGDVGGGRAPAVWAAAARRWCGRRPGAGGVRGCRWSVVWAAAA